MSEIAPGIIAAIVISGSVGIVLIVVLSVFIPRSHHMRELRQQYRQQYALRLQSKMKPLRIRGHQHLSKLSTTATRSITPSPTDSPTSRRSTSYDELDWMEKDIEGDESGEVASKVHDAFHAIKQVQESNDEVDMADNQTPIPPVIVVSTAYDIIPPTVYDPVQRAGHMRMSLSASNFATTSKGMQPSLILFLAAHSLPDLDLSSWQPKHITTSRV